MNDACHLRIFFNDSAEISRLFKDHKQKTFIKLTKTTNDRNWMDSPHRKLWAICVHFGITRNPTMNGVPMHRRYRLPVSTCWCCTIAAGYIFACGIANECAMRECVQWILPPSRRPPLCVCTVHCAWQFFGQCEEDFACAFKRKSIEVKLLLSFWPIVPKPFVLVVRIQRGSKTKEECILHIQPAIV